MTIHMFGIKNYTI